MALTKVKSGGITDATIATADIADEAVTLAKLPHGTSSNNGKFLRANNGADPSFETLTSVGGATGVDFNDDVKARFGTGNDLQIYHTGSVSRIQDEGTGALEITSDGTGVDINKGLSEYMARFITDGAVELYHNNVKRVETESNGVTTTGRLRVTSSGDVDFNIRDTSANAVSAYVGVKTAGRVEYNCYKEGVGTKYPHVFMGYTEEYGRIDADGLKFNGDTAAANALDDYEEGDWTVGVDTGSATSSLGRYVKIGRMVHIRGEITLDHITGTNVVQVSGLPFQPLAGSGLTFEGSVRGYGAADLSTGRFTTNCTTDSGNRVGFGTMAAQGQGWEMLKHNDFNSTNNAIRFTVTYQVG